MDKPKYPKDIEVMDEVIGSPCSPSDSPKNPPVALNNTQLTIEETLDQLQLLGLEAMRLKFLSGNYSSGDLAVWRQLMKDNQRTVTVTQKSPIDDLLEEFKDVEVPEVLYQ